MSGLSMMKSLTRLQVVPLSHMGVSTLALFCLWINLTKPCVFMLILNREGFGTEKVNEKKCREEKINQPYAVQNSCFNE